MLRRLALRDFVIVPALELDFHAGFSVLTGETGAGKSILVDALQLALGSRGDASVVREGAARAEVSAEFDTPATLATWLDDAGFSNDDTLLLRRTIDAQGKSRTWINGSAATVTQLRELADQLLDIHGQHAWQGLTRPAATRELLDGQAGIDTQPLTLAFAERKAAADALERARERSDEIARERERLAWQIGELDKLGPAEGEWVELSAEHQRLAHAQSLIDAARQALEALADGETHAEGLAGRALDALQDVVEHDERLLPVIEVLQGAMVQLQDAAHTLNSYLGHAELDPERLSEVDGRLSAWMSLARRYRRPPEDLPALLASWRAELQALDAATDTATLEQALATSDARYRQEAKLVSAARKKAAAGLSTAVTQAMQTLGMGGGRFEVQLPPVSTPQSFGLESVEFAVAGHAGSTPRPLAKVASGGELSRLALAIVVTTVQSSQNAGDGAGTLIFDEIDAGIGGAVGDTVGALMKQLGRERQVLAVTHLAQVASCADHHYVVAKAQRGGSTASDVQAVIGEARVAEVARMLGGERMAGTSLAHAQAMLQDGKPGAGAKPSAAKSAAAKGRTRA
ncbi:DNA repair protein RecN [Aquabacterium sp.]|uniref:DNA repair protein RecN n=1 Tax=Aquabacterium sp. TaxID=1872578 RepID=UPI002BED2CF6|nr:DNA repair protein RecN [Aquabacterium sp.]HSW06252.1 DNA repair protein RecN [Aquabacterium sp.]